MNEPPEPIVCTAADPWTQEKGIARGQRISHPDAEYIDDRDYGGGEITERYRCPYCGRKFEVELPQ